MLTLALVGFPCCTIPRAEQDPIEKAFFHALCECTLVQVDQSSELPREPPPEHIYVQKVELSASSTDSDGDVYMGGGDTLGGDEDTAQGGAPLAIGGDNASTTGGHALGAEDTKSAEEGARLGPPAPPTHMWVVVFPVSIAIRGLIVTDSRRVSGNDRVMFLRDQDIKLFIQLLENREVYTGENLKTAIIGNPGIGKSFFHVKVCGLFLACLHSKQLLWEWD